MDLSRRQGFVGSGSHPRLDRRTETIILEFADHALQSAVLLNDAVHHRHHAGADDATEQSIEHSHGRLLEMNPIRKTSAHLKRLCSTKEISTTSARCAPS